MTITNEEILELGITPNQYFIAWCIHEKRKDLFEKLLQVDNEDKVKNDLYKLYIKGFLNCELCEVKTFNFDNIKVEKLFDIKEEIKDNLDIFARELYELFPKGVKSGTFPVRSGFEDFKKKLDKYIKSHSKKDNFHSPELIKQATISYIDRSRKNNWQYMKLAGYFIYKDGVSVLESICEELLTKTEDDRDRTNTGTFRSI